MKLKAKTKSDVVQPLLMGGVFQGWEIDVRYISPARDKELRESATSAGQFSADKYLAAFWGEAVVGWRGFTPVMLGALVELDDDSESPETDSEGRIPYTSDLALFLIRNSQPEVLENPLFQQSRALLRLVALEKKSATGDSSGS